MKDNVLKYLPSNENSVTALLRALCALKPIREVIVRLFTQSSYGAEHMDFDGISTQSGIGGSIPDMRFTAEEFKIVVEIKTSNWRGLTKNQPITYLTWLESQKVSGKFFVFLAPPRYHEQHSEYHRRKNEFCKTNPDHGIKFIEMNWLDISDALDTAGLPSISVYAKDFRNMLNEWYEPIPIKFTLSELRITDMYNSEAAKAIHNLFELISKISSEFEEMEFNIGNSFNKKWWEGEYGIYLKCKDENVLWFGIWFDFWRDHGSPLSIGVHQGKWSSKIVDRFQNAFHKSIEYPQNDTNCYFMRGIDRRLLVEDDAVRNVSKWLYQKYLDGVCDLFSDHTQVTDVTD